MRNQHVMNCAILLLPVNTCNYRVWNQKTCWISNKREHIRKSDSNKLLIYGVDRFFSTHFANSSVFGTYPVQATTNTVVIHGTLKLQTSQLHPYIVPHHWQLRKVVHGSGKRIEWRWTESDWKYQSTMMMVMLGDAGDDVDHHHDNGIV